MGILILVRRHLYIETALSYKTIQYVVSHVQMYAYMLMSSHLLPLVLHICVSELDSIASDNDLSPIRHQASIYTNAGLLSIEPLGTNFSVILIKIQNFSFTTMHLEISSAKLWPFCPGGDGLNKAIIHRVDSTDFVPQFGIFNNNFQ